MKRIPELDGIRGVAIAMVLFFHFAGPLQAAPASGLAYLQAAGRLAWSGVDLFFVLSGFLIGGILLDSRDAPDYFRRFYVRRFFRIAPIYSVALCAAAIFIMRTEIGPDPGLQVGPWYAYPLFLQNFWMAARANTAALGFLGVTWSLAIEEQFYLTLPAVIRHVRGALPYMVAVGILAAPVFRVLLFYALPRYKIAPLVLMPCRADALLLGVAAAMLIRNERSRRWLADNQNALRAAAAVLLAGAVAMTLHPGWTYGVQMVSLGLTWLALLYVCVLLLAVTQPQSWLGAALRCAPLRWLGTIAYGVYLLHQTIFFALEVLRPSWPLASTVLLALPMTFALASLSWRLFEKPLIDLGHRLTSVPLHEGFDAR